MNRALCVFVCLLAISGRVFSQVSPLEGARLHYRIIGFSFPGTENTKVYRLEIAKGNFTSEKSFQSAHPSVKESNTNKIIAEVPLFGEPYTWRVVTKTGSGEKNSPLHHFSTLPAPMSDSNATRLRIEKEALAYKDGFVFMDCTKALYDMAGRMVWFMPSGVLSQQNSETVQNLVVSPVGTITYVCQGQLKEINYDGVILNQMPKTGTSEPNIHHDGVRLKNGHYMALGNERACWRINGTEVEIKHNGGDSCMAYQGGPFGTINEYDENGKLVWQYYPSDYFLRSDIMNWKPANKNPLQVHMNAFYFDEQTNQIYMGFRNASRILKIQYPEGKVLSVFGKIYKEGDLDITQELFCEQHSMKIRDGKLYLFNNNGCGLPPIPRLEIFEEAADAKYGLRKVWEYEFNIPQANAARSGGGNMIDLPDGSIFASISLPYTGLVIVDRKKNILWNAKPEKWDAATSSWTGLSTYRATIIPTAEELYRVIWYGR